MNAHQNGNSTKGWLQALVLCSAFGTASVYSSPNLPKADDNLTISKSGSFDYVLTQPSNTIAPFAAVYIEEPSVNFSKHWLRDNRGDYTQADRKRISQTYAKLLKKSLSKDLENNTQVTLASSAATADIIFRPQLRDLNIYAPDLSIPARSDKFIHTAGIATFDLTLVDAKNNTVVAQFVDRRETFANTGNGPERTNRVTNQRHFRLLMERWSRNLIDYLIEENSVAAK